MKKSYPPGKTKKVLMKKFSMISAAAQAERKSEKR